MIWIKERCDCPICGYPTIGKYFGVYVSGGKCPKCEYVDEKACAENKKIEEERESRVKRLKENPPKFKSIEDWENWSTSYEDVKLNS